MKTVRVGKLEGARLSRVVTLARGASALTIPETMVPELVGLISELVGETGAAARVPAPAAAGPAARKRGQLWKDVRGVLGSSPRAMSFDAVLSAVSRERANEVEHSLRVLLGRRVGAGDLVRTRAGRYRIS